MRKHKFFNRNLFLVVSLSVSSVWLGERTIVRELTERKLPLVSPTPLSPLGRGGTPRKKSQSYGQVAPCSPLSPLPGSTANNWLF